MCEELFGKIVFIRVDGIEIKANFMISEKVFEIQILNTHTEQREP